MISPLSFLEDFFSSREWRGLGEALLSLFPFLEADLRVLGHPNPRAYVLSAVFSPVVLLALFLPFVLIIRRGWEFLAFLLFFLVALNLAYPKVKLSDLSKVVNRELSFALRDLLVQLRAGVMLYDAMVTIAAADYGLVSGDFSEAVKKVMAGSSEVVALQEIALSAKSEFMKKALWQIVNSLRTGADVSQALLSLGRTLWDYHQRELAAYLNTVNAALMFHLLLGVVLPALGVVFSLVLSALRGIPVDSSTPLVFMGFSLLVQLFVVGYLMASRPPVIA